LGAVCCPRLLHPLHRGALMPAETDTEQLTIEPDGSALLEIGTIGLRYGLKAKLYARLWPPWEEDRQ
jgi:hypothetical protein